MFSEKVPGILIAINQPKYMRIKVDINPNVEVLPGVPVLTAHRLRDLLAIEEHSLGESTVFDPGFHDINRSVI